MTMMDANREKVLPPCGSPMCEAPHRAIFGRCACQKPKGHEGPHDCLDTFQLSEPRAASRVRETRPLAAWFVDALLIEAERQERAGTALLYITPEVQRRLCEAVLNVR